MSWRQIGDVALDMTERLNEPRLLKLTVCHVSSEPRVVKVPIRVVEQARRWFWKSNLNGKRGRASHEQT
jgi:hypothetical protein